MSMVALLSAVKSRLQSVLALDDSKCDVMFDGHPKPSCGEEFISIWPGGWRGVDIEGLMEVCGANVTLTIRVGQYPFDRRSMALTEPRLRQIIAAIHLDVGADAVLNLANIATPGVPLVEDVFSGSGAVAGRTPDTVGAMTWTSGVNCSITGGRLVFASAGYEYAYLDAGVGRSDCTVTAKLAVAGSAAPGLIGRFGANYGDCWQAVFTGGTVSIVESTAFVETVRVAAVAATWTATSVLGFVFRGNAMKVQIDGVDVAGAAYTSSAKATNTSYGLRGVTAAWDDFKVTAGVNAFVEPLRFVDGGRPEPVGPDWFNAAMPDNGPWDQAGVTQTIRFDGAKRVQAIESMG